jgi:glycosyltransferase involved in cell wall biosynthesis
MSIAAGGKSFLLDGVPFEFRGLRYPALLEEAVPRECAADRFARDLASLAAAGYTVVCLPPPPRWAIQPAAASGLRFVVDLGCAGLDRLAAMSWRERRHHLRELTARIRETLRPWDRCEALLGVALERPEPVGQSRRRGKIARRAADEVAIVIHDLDAKMLTAWRDRWPHLGECPAEFDFLLVDCALPSRDALSPALMACHGEVGDRPLVLGSVSLPGADADAALLIDTALRCGAAGTLAETWRPGHVRRHGAIRRIHTRSVRDLDLDWPSMSVVINAHNAASTLEECLSHCDRLDYPELEVIVVDDGSTDATPAIARTHPRTRLITIPHSGLPAARNVGYQSARRDLVVYLDADAYPSPAWPWYVALAGIGDRVGASGGPNIPPSGMSMSARIAARSPGSPIPQLLRPDRAKHLPGCNMAFRREVLCELGGFDPLLEGAEDIELEWRVVQSDHEIGYHPAALVWHYRQPGLRRYLRQQRLYGRHYAILERRYPERFPAGGRILNAARRLRLYRGDVESAPSYPVRYLSLPREDHVVLQLVHQWGMPVAIALTCTAPLGLVRRRLAAPSVAATAFVGALFLIDVAVAGAGRRRRDRTLGLRVGAAAFQLLRPLAFRWGHLTGWLEQRNVT